MDYMITNMSNSSLNKKESVKTMRMINLISGIIEKSKQKTIKKIVKRLNKMSPNDVFTLARIIKV